MSRLSHADLVILTSTLYLPCCTSVKTKKEGKLRPNPVIVYKAQSSAWHQYWLHNFLDQNKINAEVRLLTNYYKFQNDANRALNCPSKCRARCDSASYVSMKTALENRCYK